MTRRSPEKRRAAAAPRRPVHRTPGYEDLLAIARLVESGSRFTEFRLRSGDIEVEVKRANGVQSLGPGSSPVDARGDEGVRSLGPGSSPAGARGDEGSPSARGDIPDLPAGTHLIKAPMVGTFYRAPEPGAKPFVEPGARVRPDTVVCIIEVMKLMNSVVAGVSGTVTHVLADNAAMVEPGQPLVAIRPE